MSFLSAIRQLLPTTFDADALDALRTERPRTVLLDVREPDEFADGHLAGSVLVPLAKVAHHAGMIAEAGVPVVVICRAGARAASAAGTLRAAGAAEVHVLSGGVLAWQGAGRSLERGSRSPSLVNALKGRA
jgi:rhodanese-related sulfurtransferase